MTPLKKTNMKDTNFSDVNGTRPGTNLDENAFSPIALGFLVSIYAVIFIIAFFGNVMTILTCYASYRRTTSILLRFIASLAVADLLFTLLTTIDLVYVLSGNWPGGRVTCAIQRFLSEMSYSASSLTLAAISYERYHTVVLKGAKRMRRKRIHIVKGVWIASILLCLPLLYGYTTVMRDDGKERCVNWISWGHTGKRVYYGLTTVAKFISPLSLMIWAHVKIVRVLSSHNRNNRISTLEAKQRKTTKMLAVVTLAFCCCWCPAVIVRLLMYFAGFEGKILWKGVQLLFFANCALNPVLYCFYDRQFRSSFKRMMSLGYKSKTEGREQNVLMVEFDKR